MAVTILTLIINFLKVTMVIKESAKILNISIFRVYFEMGSTEKVSQIVRKEEFRLIQSNP